MRANRFATLAVLLLLAALPAAAQVNDTYVIAAAANASGAFGTQWMTQISLFNPHLTHKLIVSVTLIPTARPNAPIEEFVEVPANSVAWSDNILADLFDPRDCGGTCASGSLLLATFPEDNPGVPNDRLSRSFLVTSNTFNNSRTGTYGQTIPGVWVGLMDDDISAVSHGISNIDRLGWRTNVGAVNLGRCNVTLFMNVYNANGSKVNANPIPFEILPMAHVQQRLQTATGGTLEIDKGSVEFWVSDPCATRPDDYAVVFPYTSTIDQLSGDPTYQVPTLLAAPNGLYGKKGVAIDPQNVGKKISLEEAARVRAIAKRGTTPKTLSSRSTLRLQ